MKRFMILLLLWHAFTFVHAQGTPYNYLSKPNVQRFIAMMHHRYGFSIKSLEKTFRHARYDKETLARYTGHFKPGSTVGTWERFKLHIVNKPSFRIARDFKRKYAHTLHKAEKRFGVDGDCIVGFLGVESGFGKFTGDYRLIDALSTLAFHPNRKEHFFRNELKHLFLFAREHGYAIETLKGSFAGAMGCVQQLPSVARRFHFDFDGDGASVWDIDDCIGSIAKFMHTHGWKKGMPAAVEATFDGKRFRKLKSSFRRSYPTTTLLRSGLKPTQPFPYPRAYLLRVSGKVRDRVFLGTPNFRILTRYNPSTNYGVAIHLIAASLKD